MTSDQKTPDSIDGHPIDLELRLCAEGETTLLERIRLATPYEVIETVLERFGIPEAVLRDEIAEGQPPVGWVVPAPTSVSTAASPFDTPLGRFRAPAAHIEVMPVLPGFGFTTSPWLPLCLDDATRAVAFADAGLLDSADAGLRQLWRSYRSAATGSGLSPQRQFDDLLSVHTRARSAGAMLLAAHAADNVGGLLHRVGSFNASAYMHRWALGVYGRGHHQTDRAIALVNLAHSLWHDDRPQPAAQAGALASRIAARVGSAVEQRRAALITAYALVDLDQPHDALHVLEEAGPAPRGEPLTMGWLQHAHGTARLATGELAAAHDHARSALAAAARAEDAIEADSLRIETHLLAAHVAAAEGDQRAAEQATTLAEAARLRLPAPLTH